MLNGELNAFTLELWGKLVNVPVEVLVVGDEDAEEGTVGVNERGSERPERGVKVDDLVERLKIRAAERV